MDFVKSYGLWILLGIAALVLLVAQVVYVGGARAAAARDNDEIKTACENVIRLGRKIKSGDYPTKGDLRVAREHLEKIREERLAVQAKWREHTEGLNRYMSGETRPGGEVTDPETVRTDAKTGKKSAGRAIKWDLFASRIRDLYNLVFKRMQDRIERKMTPRLARMLADEKYAASAVMTSGEATKRAEQEAASVAALRKKILLAPDKLVLVPVDQRFGAEVPEDGWREWRKYLIIRDILERAVANTEVRMSRTLSTYLMPSGKVVDDAARAQRAKAIEEGDAADLPKLKTVAWRRPVWRYVEQVVSIDIDGPKLGNAELPGKGWVEDLSKGGAKSGKSFHRKRWSKAAARKTATRGGKAGDKRNDKQALDRRELLKPQVPPAGRDAVYHDVFTVTIEIKAHPKVIEAFHRELLKAPDIWYAPLELVIQRLPDSEVMGISGKATATAEGLAEVIPEVAPVRTKASFDHEPPVTARLKYQVYRFRYSDQDNDKRTAALAPSGRKTTSPGRGRWRGPRTPRMPPDFR